ncbi:MAG: GxxExxY protein [Chloroflexaceae bacterium]
MGESTTQDYVDDSYAASATTALIIAAALEVHRTLGPGFQEIIYQRALALELPAHGIECEREVSIDVFYKGRHIGRRRVDFVAAGVMVELKAKAAIEDVDFVQALSYLKASGFKIGLLLNFGARRLEIRRLAN